MKVKEQGGPRKGTLILGLKFLESKASILFHSVGEDVHSSATPITKQICANHPQSDNDYEMLFLHAYNVGKYWSVFEIAGSNLPLKY